jgi:hypothetical protein
MFNKSINAVVKPHPGQWISNIKFHMQGIVMLNPEIAYKIDEKTK